MNSLSVRKISIRQINILMNQLRPYFPPPKNSLGLPTSLEPRAHSTKLSTLPRWLFTGQESFRCQFANVTTCKPYRRCGSVSSSFSHGTSQTTGDGISHHAGCGNGPHKHGAWYGVRTTGSITEIARPNKYSCNCTWTTRTCGKCCT